MRFPIDISRDATHAFHQELLLLIVIFAIATLAMLTGCGYSGSMGAYAPATRIAGTVHGGRSPVSGSQIQLYATGASGNASPAIALLHQEVKSDSQGNFSIPGGYECPSASSQVYLLAKGGSQGNSSGRGNSAITLIAMLGSCNSLPKSPISVNEVTTIGSIWPLADYASGPTSIGSPSGDTRFATAVSTVPEFINVIDGTSPGSPQGDTYFNESSKLYSLADVMANCANSSGGKAGDGSPCGELFSMATLAGGKAPSDIVSAAISIARNPQNNVNEIYSLAAAETSFQPALEAAPLDWTLNLSTRVATPVLSLASGNYNTPQTVSIADATPGSVIHYTVDGTIPTASSSAYAGPIPITATATVQAIAVLSGSSSAVASSTITIGTAGPATRLAFVQQPSDTVAGAVIAPSVRVAVEDAKGNVVTSENTKITLSLNIGSGLSGMLTTSTQNGIATFNYLAVNTAGTGYTLSAAAPKLASATSSPFNVTSSNTASKLAFVQQPSNAVAGATIAPAVTVAVEDAKGNVVSSATNQVTLLLRGGSGLQGTLTATPLKGIAVFPNLSVTNAASGLTLVASSSNLASTTSSAFTINAASTAAKLAFVQQPSNAAAGATIAPAVTVAVEDAKGNVVTSATNQVTLLLRGGSGLQGTLTATPLNGIAVFPNLSVTNVASGLTLVASSSNLASTTSSAFTINAASTASKLAFVQQPSNAAAGATIAPAVTVAIGDSKGNVVPSAKNVVTLFLRGGSGLQGAFTAIPQNGIATFSDLSVSSAASSLALVATSSNLAPATSSSFTISSATTASVLTFTQQPTNTVAGATMTPAVSVAVKDAKGNIVTSAANIITLALVGGTGLQGTLSVAARNGIATFANLSLTSAGSGYTLVASSGTLSSATSSAFAVIAAANPPTKLAFSQQPSNAAAGAIIAPAVTVAVEDVNGTVLTSATNQVTLALSGGGGLEGTLTAPAVKGIATFSNLSVITAGSGLSIVAASPNLTSATSSTFNITTAAGTPAKLAFSQQPSNANAGAILNPAVKVAIEDANGNVVTSASGTITLSLVGGSGLGGTLSLAAQNGIATFSDLFVANAGNGYMLQAAGASLPAVTSSTFSIAATSAPATKLVFSQQPSNAVAGAVISPAVKVAVEDATGNIVTSATNTVTLALGSGAGLQGTLSVAAQNGVATFSDLSLSTVATGYTLQATSPNLTSATSSSFAITASTPVTNGTTVLPSAPVSLTATPGGSFQIAYSWQGVAVPSGYSIFVNFVDSTGKTQFQDNVQPNPAPTAWTGAVNYTHTVFVPSGAPTGSYKIIVGIASSVGNLSLTAGAGVTTVATGQYQTGTLTLAPTCSIEQFGAKGDGVTNNFTAIQNTFNYAAAHGCIALIPAGTFAYAGRITATGIAVTGTGAASVLAPSDVTDEALVLSGNGASASNLSMVSKATTRLSTPWSGMIWASYATNYYVNNVLINGSSSIGIMSYFSNNGYIFNNTIMNTLADSITQMNPAYSITIVGNRIVNSGDDGISSNSYADNDLIHDITVRGNTILNNVWGRGLEVSGGSNIVMTGNYVSNSDGYADLYISSEAGWNTQSVSNITVSGNTFMAGGPNTGSALIYNSQGTTYSISNVAITGNQFVQPSYVAVQLLGNGSETGISLQNNNSYSTSGFLDSSNPLASVTQSGNQTLSPAALANTQVSAGGGCNFSGC